MSDRTKRNARRIVSCVAALVAVPSYFYCEDSHYCMCGHLAHPPIPWWDYANDIGYLTLLICAGVFAVASNMRLRLGFAACVGLMLVSRVVFAGRGVIGLCEVLALGFVVILSVLELVHPKRANEAGHCQECGYDLTGNVSGVCPECGTPVVGDSGKMSS